MTDQKQIDLLVRANIQGKKDLESVGKSIDSISAALDKQTAAAKRGESSLDELKGSMAALEVEKRKLSDNQALISGFATLSDRITKTEKSATKASSAYEKYKKELEGLAKVTDTQQDKLIRLSTASERAAARLVKQRTDQQALTETLREAGITTNDLAGAQDKLRATYAQYAAVFSKAQAAISSYSQDVREAREAEKSLVAENTFQKKLTDAAKLAKADDYIQFWTNSLNAADKAQAELTANQSLKKLADDAERSARSFTTLSVASNNLRPNVVSLRDAVNAIVNPGQELRKTLGGVEQEVTDLAAAVSKIKGPVTEYRTTLASLDAAQKAIGKQSGLVDELLRQRAAARAAYAEFSTARAQVQQYAAAVRQGGAAGQQFVAALGEAQVRARGAAEALRSQIAVTKASRDAVRAAGIATDDLAAAQTRLTNSARATVNTTQLLTAAVKEYGLAQEKANKPNKGGGIFGDEGRTTLSFVQRLRGEVLSLAAAYGGLYGVINTAKGALDAFSSREGAKNQLSISVGSSKAAIDAEYAYVKAQSDRIGLEFERTIKGYAKFSAAATLAGRGRQEIRAVFEAFSEVSRVANLSADDLDGVFKALEQIYSKGTIQAEELRGQLGDRLFGAFEIAASALKDQFPDLEKAMKNGLITSDQLVKIAGKYRDIVANELPAAQKSLAAEQMRVNNAVYDFQLAVADSGWVDAYKRALVVITDFMKSSEGENAAKQFGNALILLANAFVVVAKNVEYLTPLMSLLVGYLAFKGIMGALTTLGSIAAGLNAIAPAAGAATGGVIAFTASLSTMAKVGLGALGILSAGFAGWALGDYLYGKSAEVRKFGTFLVTGFAEIWSIISHSYEAAFEAFPLVAKNAFAAVLNTISFAARKMLGIFASLASAAGLDGVAKTLTDAANQLTVGYADVGKVIDNSRKRLEADLQRISDLRYDMAKDNEKPRGTATDAVAKAVKEAATQTAIPTVTGKKAAKDSGGEAAAKKLETLKNQIEAALNAIDTKIDRSQTESLQAQLQAVDSQYEELRKKIAAVGGATGRGYMEQLDNAISQLKGNITDKFYKGIADDFDALMAELSNVSAAAGRKDKLDLEARQQAIVDSYQGLYQKIEAMRQKLDANGRSTAGAEEAKGRLDVYVQELKDLEAIKFAKEELARREARLNELLKLREAQTAAINAQKEAGKITDTEAAAQINQLNVEALPAINAAGEATKAWAEANAAIFATPEDKAIFLAQLEALRVKAAQTKTEFDAMGNALTQGLVKGVDAGLNGVFDGLEKIATGQQSVAEGFQGIAQAFAAFASQFLRDIAIMIAKQLFFNALKNSGNPFLAAAGAAGSATVNHAGGVVGSYSSGRRSRTVDTAWFANAPRYHSGGVPGLASDEYATILQKGEEVLTADSPRNIMNGGANLGGGSGDSSGMRVVLVDDRAKVAEAMSSSEGERVIVQAIKRNLPSVKQMLKG